MTNYTREAQRDNPEVLLCVSREPRYRTEASLLQHVTRELNILTYHHVCSDDDEDCFVDLAATCEYYQLPQIKEDSFEPTSVSSGNLDDQMDACEEDRVIRPTVVVVNENNDTTSTPFSEFTTSTPFSEFMEPGGSGTRAAVTSWIVIASLSLAVLVLDSML